MGVKLALLEAFPLFKGAFLLFYEGESCVFEKRGGGGGLGAGTMSERRTEETFYHFEAHYHLPRRMTPHRGRRISQTDVEFARWLFFI